MSASFRLNIATSRYVGYGVDGVRMRCECTAACGASPKIFAYLRSTLNPETMETTSSFSHVCSPNDLEEYPEDGPIPHTSPQFFRLNYVDVLFRSVGECERSQAILRQHVALLKRTLDFLEELEPGEEVVVGELECEDESDSLGSDSDSDSDSAGEEGTWTEYFLTAHGGSYENGYGIGKPWRDVQLGAGTPTQDSDSLSDGIGQSFSTTTLGCSEYSQILVVQGYILNVVPDEARILGVGCRIIFRYSPDGDVPELAMLSLMHWALGLSTNRAAEANAAAVVIEPGVIEIVVDGDPSNLWGLELTAERLKEGDFGIVLSFAGVGGRPTTKIDVDGVELFVKYEVQDA